IAVTPSGRGRVNAWYMMPKSNSATARLPTNVNTWRQRLSTIRARISAVAAAGTAQPTPMRAIGDAMSVSQSVRSRANCRNTAASARSVTRPARRDRRLGLAALDLCVELAEDRGRQPRGHGVDELHQLGTELFDDLGADQRDHVLRRLQPAVIGQLDETPAFYRGVGRKQEG